MVECSVYHSKFARKAHEDALDRAGNPRARICRSRSDPLRPEFVTRLSRSVVKVHPISA